MPLCGGALAKESNTNLLSIWGFLPKMLGLQRVVFEKLPPQYGKSYFYTNLICGFLAHLVLYLLRTLVFG